MIKRYPLNCREIEIIILCELKQTLLYISIDHDGKLNDYDFVFFKWSKSEAKALHLILFNFLTTHFVSFHYTSIGRSGYYLGQNTQGL